jgi:4'-phosphopantetheinyl transferase
VCKEAFVKACGEGLSRSLKDWEVRISATEPATLLQVHGDQVDFNGWSLFGLAPAADYVGAVAVDQPHAHLACLQMA